MDQIVSGIIITVITSLVAWLSQRASNKASITNVATSSRVEMEKEAYERARKLDTETIERQDEELKDLEEKYEKLQLRFDNVYEANQTLNDDMARITHDNYQLHRENTRILELNEQILAENRRLRETGERLIENNRRLQAEVGSLRDRVTRMQRGMDPNSTEPIRHRGTDTDPMMPEVPIGRE